MKTQAHSTANRRIGILGGTFDPIHRGHVELGAAAEAALGLSGLLVIASKVPPHRPQPFASSYHRFAMVALAVAGRRGWCASDLELRDDALSYTSDTLRRLHATGFAAEELFFVIGADAFLDIGGWKDYPAILENAHFAVASRPGCPVDDLPIRLPALRPRMIRPHDSPAPQRPMIFLIDAATADVSSTAIRQRCADGDPINGLVDPGVQQHIEQHGLYTSLAPGRRESARQPSPAAGRLHGES